MKFSIYLNRRVFVMVMSIYGKGFKTLHLQKETALRLNRYVQHQVLKVYHVYSNDEHRMNFDLFWQGQVCLSVRVEKSFFSRFNCVRV